MKINNQGDIYFKKQTKKLILPVKGRLKNVCFYLLIFSLMKKLIIWKPPSLGELTPIIFNKGLTHLGSEASIYLIIFGSSSQE